MFDEGGEGEDAVVGPKGGGGLGLAKGEDSGGGEVGSLGEGMEGDTGEVLEVDEIFWQGAEVDGAVSG